jgi:DNA invertase Pin-like site-specific DNA recombinase
MDRPGLPLDLSGCQVQWTDGSKASPGRAVGDTGTSTGRLMIAVLGGLADVERDLIRTRTAERRSRVNTHGKHAGRPRKWS